MATIRGVEMAPVEIRSREQNRLGAPTRQAARPDGLIRRRFRKDPFVAALILCLWATMQAQDGQMKITRNRTLVLTFYVQAEPVDGPSFVPFYWVVLQKDPFVEIHLQTPVSRSRLNQRRQRFFCQELGVFTDASSRQTWTIGRVCKPL
jgi:hypothetical protein